MSPSTCKLTLMTVEQALSAWCTVLSAKSRSSVTRCVCAHVSVFACVRVFARACERAYLEAPETLPASLRSQSLCRFLSLRSLRAFLSVSISVSVFLHPSAGSVNLAP